MLSLNLYKYLLSLKNELKNPVNFDLNTVTKAHSLLSNYISTKTNYKLKTPELIESLYLG